MNCFDDVGGKDIGFSSEFFSLPLPAYAPKKSAALNKGFIKSVLGWNLRTLHNKLEEAASAPELPLNHPSTSNYYELFLALVLEEARAATVKGLEQKNRSFQIELIKDVEGALQPTDPLTMHVKGGIPKNQEHSPSMNVLLLRGRSVRGEVLTILALASEVFNRPELKIKFMVPIFCKNESFSYKGKWSATYLASLVTHHRIFEACLNHTDSPCLPQIIEAKLPELSDPHDPNVAQFIQTLNDSQQRGVQQFIALSEGVAIAQGPPGTGKTRMISAILDILYRQGKRTLVCGPSNKSVQVPAERFIENHPNGRVILVGVEGKIPHHLRSISLHTWREDLINLLNSVDKLPSFALMGKESFLSELSVMERNVLSVRERITRYHFEKDLVCEKMFEKVISSLQMLREQTGEFDPGEEINSEKPLECLKAHLTDRLNALKRLNERILNSPLFVMDRYTFEIELLNRSDIIFSTLSVSGRPHMLHMHSVEVAIVDEAGQSVEAETLIPLQHSPNKILFVGDTKQLSATVISPLAKSKGYARSLVERLEQNGQPRIFLDTQYRMDPEISEWVSDHNYEGRLVTAPSVERNTMTGLRQPIAFYDINLGNEAVSGTSRQNDREAIYVIECIRKLRETDADSRIGVITFYAAQVAAIQSLMKEESQSIGKNVTVNTVDGFQGEECEIIILSCVCANESDEIGFLKDPRRWNVAVSRAKRTLIVLGNARTLRSEESDLKSMIDDLERRNKFFTEDHLDANLGLETKPVTRILQLENARKNSLGSIRSLSHSFSAPAALDALDWRTRANTTLKPGGKSMDKINAIAEQGICWFFNGNPTSCRNGDRCRYSHIG